MRAAVRAAEFLQRELYDEGTGVLYRSYLEGRGDISGFADPDYLSVAAAAGATVVATHIRLQPRVADPNPEYSDVVADVSDFLVERARRAEAAGLGADGRGGGLPRNPRGLSAELRRAVLARVRGSH